MSSLKLKILFFTVLIIILIGAATGLVIINRVTGSIEAQIGYRLNSLASNMALNAEDPLILEDDIYLAGLVSDVMTNEGFLYAKILYADYSIAASDRIEEWGTTDSSMVFNEAEEISRSADRIEVLKPVMLGNEKLIGFVKLGISTAEINKARNDIIILISAITGIFILLGIIVSFFFSSFITKQLNLLMDGVKKVAGGDFNVNVNRVTGDELGVLTDTFNQMVVNIREKEMIKIAFTRYVSKQVAEKVFEDPDAFLNKLKGERTEVSVVFADIMGFTTMSEKMPPEEVVGILNTYLTKMTDAVFTHNGTLDKFIGDCVMAVFGTPIPLENPSLNAVQCAIDIQRGVNELNLHRRSKGLAEIGIGIGINTGIAVVGNIGSNERLDYTVIGDNVNLASRLQSTANSMNIPIIVSKTVVEHIQGQVEYTELEPVKVKGKEKPVHIYSINL